MGWNDVWTAATLHNLVSATAFNMFYSALEERRLGLFTPLVPTVSGAIFNSASLVQSLQARAEALITNYTKRETWAGKSYTTGDASPFVTWTVPTAFASLGVSGWPRKYPREFTNLASTTYTDGSAFANGHKARNRADGKVYLRSGGAWVVQAAGTMPDAVTTTGQAQQGDYVTPAVFNTLRDFINLMDLKTLTVTISAWATDTLDNGLSSPFGSDPTWAGAIAEAEANYTLGGGSGGIRPQSSIGGELNVLGDYVASVARMKSYIKNLNASSAPVGSTVRFFYALQAASGQTYVDFDGLGAQNTWGEIGTGAVRLTTPTTVTSDKIGGLSIPTWPSAPTGPAGTAGAKNEGYRVVKEAALWDARNSFQYSTVNG